MRRPPRKRGTAMENRMIYLETGSQDPYYNLAFEEYILTHRLEGDYLLLWQNENTVVIGQNQIAEAEVDLSYAKEHQIKIVRRTTGGGAVYHDLGNLNYSFITDVGDREQLTMERFTEPVVRTLRTLGLRAEASGRNDILVEGCKVSGTAQRIYQHRILYHGTLLFQANKERANAVLRVNPLKFQGKFARSVSSRIGNIGDFLKEPMSLSDFWGHLKKGLSADNILRQEELSMEEKQAIHVLREEKYASKAWNFRHIPSFDLKNVKKWDGGILEVRLSTEKGRITAAAFYGDFLSQNPLDEIEQALVGTEFTPEAIGHVLEAYPLPMYFGGITCQEILRTIF